MKPLLRAQILEDQTIDTSRDDRKLLQVRSDADVSLGEYVDIFDSAPVGYLILDRDDSIRRVNLAAARLLGVKRNRLINRRFHLFISPVTRPSFNAFLESAFEGQGQKRCEMTLLTASKSPLYVQLEAHVTEDGMQCRVVLVDITERKKHEDSLSEQLDLAKRIHNATEEHWAMVSADGTILEINQAWRQFAKDNQAGDETHWGVGANYFQRYSEEWGDTTRAEDAYDGLRQVLQGTLSRFQIEYPCHAPTEKRWFLMKVLPFPGKPGTVLVYHTNLTERKRAEDALLANEALLKQFVEHTPAAVAMFDREVRYLLYSKRWLIDYKLGDRDITGLSHYEVFPDIPDRWKRIHQSVLAGSAERCEEDPFERADGSIEWIRWEVLPWQNEAGEIGGIIMYTEVITERKRADEALHESNQLLKVVLDTIPVHVFWKDAKSVYMGCNGMFAADSGLASPALCVGKSDFELAQTREEAESYRSDDRDVIEAGIPKLGYEETHFTADGRLTWVRTSKVPLRDAAGSVIGVLGIYEDITARKRVEEEKRQFYRETIKGVTQGKLDLVAFGEVKEYLDRAEETASVHCPADVPIVRHEIIEYCSSRGLSDSRLGLFDAAVGEAITNAIKHATSGQVYAGSRGSSVWVAVSDQGPGISALTLPSATLRKGFSTKASMGMGYSIMMEASDYILLCTGKQGTTVVLSASNSAPGEGVSLDAFPDTWATDSRMDCHVSSAFQQDQKPLKSRKRSLEH